jgi:hypothetical protein
MAGSIANFKSSFNKDVARPNRFDVTINIPLILLPYVKDSRQLSFRCEAADMPGRSLETTERKIGSAPTQKVPYRTQYNESTFIFIVSDDMAEKILFEGWIESINPTSNYNFNYKSNYVTSILVNQYDVNNNLSYQAQLIDAFPIAVNQLDLDWSTDGHHKLAVVFAYTNWTTTTLKDIVKNIGTQVINSALF